MRRPASREIQGDQLALGPFRLSKLEHLWDVWGIEISMRDRRGTLISIPVLGLSSHFGWSKKHQSVRIQKNVLFDTSCFKNLLLTYGKIRI